jgi:hypothetical protein
MRLIQTREGEMSTSDEQQSDLVEERGYGAAKDDVNEETPPQDQPQPPNPEAGKGATADEFTEEAREATETGPGRGAD